LGTVLKIMAGMVNGIHDMLITISAAFGLNLTDKALHFWIVGIVGIITFFLADFVFKWVSRWSISVVTFIYTFTVLVVLVFGLEIEQKITGRGVMEFKDIVFGLWGFILIFSAYVFIRAVIYGCRKLYDKRRAEKSTGT